jgi:predicted small lipoprotein YifL
MLRRLLILLALVASAACGAPSEVPPEDRPRTRSDRLTEQEIQRTELTNMFDVIQRLQPGWLRSPRSSGINLDIGVFVDNTRVGGLDFLRQIPASQVTEARYLNSRQITAELTGNQSAGLGGAIMLSTRRGR